MMMMMMMMMMVMMMVLMMMMMMTRVVVVSRIRCTRPAGHQPRPCWDQGREQHQQVPAPEHLTPPEEALAGRHHLEMAHGSRMSRQESSKTEHYCGTHRRSWAVFSFIPAAGRWSKCGRCAPSPPGASGSARRPRPGDTGPRARACARAPPATTGRRAALFSPAAEVRWCNCQRWSGGPVAAAARSRAWPRGSS